MSDVLLSTIVSGAPPSGTGFRHVTSGVEDAASIAETGTGSVVLSANAVHTGTPTFVNGNVSGNWNIDGTITYSGGDFTLDQATTNFEISAAVSTSNIIFKHNLGTYLTLNSTTSIFGSAVSAVQNFASTTTTAVLATSAAGTVYLRPNGAASTTGQVSVNSAGQVTLVNDFFFPSLLSGTTTTVVLATSAAGNIYLRPNGSGSTTGQARIDSGGCLFLEAGGGVASSSPAMQVSNGGSDYVGIFGKLGSGAYNSCVQANDKALVAFNASGAGTAGFVLTTWGTNAGVRITDTAVTLIGTTLTMTGAVTGSSTISDSLGNLRIVPVTNKTAGFTLALTDANQSFVKSNSTTQAHTVPPNSSVAFPVGTMLTFHNLGGTTLNLTVTRGVGVSIYHQSATSGDIALTPGQSVTLQKVATDIWMG